MVKKIYDGLSGIAKVGIAGSTTYLLFPVFIGNFSYIVWSGTGELLIPIFYLLTIFAFAGFVGQVGRGLLQLYSVFKPDPVSKAAELGMDALLVIGGSVGYIGVMRLTGDLRELGMLYFLLYWVPFALALLDAVILAVEMKKEGKKSFSAANRLAMQRGAKIVMVLVLIYALGATFNEIITTNRLEARLNEGVKGGFDSFTMYDFDGNEYTEEMFRGHKVTMINVWGTYCHPCIEEMPELEEIAESYDPAQFQLVGMPGNLYIAGTLQEAELEKARNIMDVTGVKYPVLIPSLEIQAGVIDEAMYCYPTTVFVNEKGEELRAVSGARSKEQWINLIEEVIANEE